MDQRNEGEVHFVCSQKKNILFYFSKCCSTEPVRTVQTDRTSVNITVNEQRDPTLRWTIRKCA